MNTEYIWRVLSKKKEDGLIYFCSFMSEPSATAYAVKLRGQDKPPVKVWVEKMALPDYLRKVEEAER